MAEKESVPKSRGKRSWFGVIGKLSKAIFGTATEDCVNLLASHINALNKGDYIYAVEQHEQDLYESLK